MERQRAHLEEAGAAPGRIVAVRADGRPLAADGLSSPTWCEIEYCYAIGTEIGVKFKTRHRFTGANPVTVRVDGEDDRSSRAHPANNWSGGALRDPSTGALSNAPNAYAWGGDPWEIEVIDAYRIRLIGSVWKTDPADNDPVFSFGWAYEELVPGAHAALIAAFAHLDGRPGAVSIGIGAYGLRASDVGQIEVPGNVTITFADRRNTHLVAEDFYNRQMLTFVGSNWLCTGGSLWMPRAFMGHSRHPLRIGSEDATAPIENGTLRGMSIYGPSGYGINNGKNTDKRNLVIDDVEIFNAKNDLVDIKNKARGNRHNRLSDLTGKSPGMGTIGTNAGMVLHTLPANPIATVDDGRTTVVVTTRVKARINDTLWLPPVTVHGVVLGGWYRVVGHANFTSAIETGQQANATGSGGGTGLQTMHFRREPGSTAFDLRGPGWTVTNPKISGDLDQNIGPRTRGGNGANGPGAHLSSISNAQVTDECRHPTSSANLLVAQSDEIAVIAPVLKGRGGNNQGASVGLTIGSLSARAQVKGAIISHTGTGALLNGSDADFDGSTYACGVGVVVTGTPVGTAGDLDATAPFTIATAGIDPVVRCKATVAHGFSGGETITFESAQSDPAIGVDMNDTFVVGTPYNSTEFPVIATGQQALTAGTFGGRDVEYITAPIETSAADNQISARIFASYSHPIVISTKAARTKVINSHAQDSANAEPSDLSTSTIWGPGNTGELPNNDQVINVPDATTALTLAVGDSGKTVVWSGTGTLTITLPDPTRQVVRGFKAKVLFRNSSPNELKLYTPAGLIANGASSGTVATTSTQGARAEINCLYDSRYNLLPRVGDTWTFT